MRAKIKLGWVIDHRDYKTPMPEQLGATKSIEYAYNQGDRGHGLFMDGGTGKTLVAYNTFLQFKKAGIVDQMQIECPNFAKGVWREHLAYCGRAAKGLDIKVWPETPDGADVWVYNWEMTQHAYSRKIAFDHARRRRTFFVPDESHRGKDFKSKHAKSMMEVGKASIWTMPMTGTPMGENVMDLWPQLRAMGAISGTTPFAFRGEYAEMGGWMGKKIVGMRNEDRLEKLLDRCSYRAVLSSRTEHLYGDVHCEMTGAQKQAYLDLYRDRFLPLIEDESYVSADMIITVLLKLQQIASGYVIDNDRNIHEIVKPKDNSRLRGLKDALSDVEGKAVIFTGSRYSTDLIYESLPGSACIRGGMAEDEITRQRDAFNEDPKVRYFIAPIQMAKESLTLLGDQSWPDRACRDTFMYETPYSRIGRTQGEWRTSRKGQRYPVRYWDFRSTSNLGKGVIDVDLQTSLALRKKQDMVETFRPKARPS